MVGGCWCAGVTHTLGIAVPSSIHHFLSGRWSPNGSRLSRQRGAMTATCGSAAPGTELNEWRRDARSEVRHSRWRSPCAPPWAAGPRRAQRGKGSWDKFEGGERWCGAVLGLKAERSPHPLTLGGWA